jgi:hypothetical protein
METKRITVKIDPLGNPTVEAHGFNGVGCAAATAGIESALNSAASDATRVIKPEWLNPETVGEAETQKMIW